MSDPLASLVTLGSLFGIFFVISVMYRRYRLDLFRERLFALRDELFSLGLEKSIEFDHISYRELRLKLDRTIRFAEQYTLSEMIIVQVAERRNPGYYKEFEDHHAKVDAETELLPESVKEKIRSIEERINREAFAHIIFTSSILMSMILPMVIWSLIVRFGGVLLGGHYSRLRKYSAQMQDLWAARQVNVHSHAGSGHRSTGAMPIL